MMHASDFNAKIANDPVAHLITSMHIHAWADGYEQGVRDCFAADMAGIEDLLRMSFNDVCQLALERLSEQRRESDRAQLLAIAELARVVPGPLS